MKETRYFPKSSGGDYLITDLGNQVTEMLEIIQVTGGNPMKNRSEFRE